MRYFALATDYDGTIALHGHVDAKVVDAMKRLKNSGRKLILVTGRELDDLKKVFSDLEIFDRIVAENGALIYRPASNEERTLADAPPPYFAEALISKGVSPISIGKVIVATWEPHENTVLDTIRELGLELQVIFNKGAVMILPSGINKAKGLADALEELGLSAHNVVSVGDAENDNAFLKASECAVAVSNALPSLKEQADWITPSDHGFGVIELIDQIIENDLIDIKVNDKHSLLLGTNKEGEDVRISSYGENILVAGTSGGGKSTFTTAFIERLIDQNYQFCLLDPEGDYLNLEKTVVFGDADHPPTLEEVLKFVQSPSQNAVICTLAIPLNDRPAFFQKLLPALIELRTRTGRPHWIILDEAHHLLPSSWTPSLFNIPKNLPGICLITLKAELINKAILEDVNIVVAIGETPDETINNFTSILDIPSAKVSGDSIEKGEAIVWIRNSDENPFWIKIPAPQTERTRHIRKYSAGELEEDKSFYFQGPEGKLNLKAQNLTIFLQIAQGIDDETWNYHLKRNEYSEWARASIKDNSLAEEIKKVEQSESNPTRSKAAIHKLIEMSYTGVGAV